MMWLKRNDQVWVVFGYFSIYVYVMYLLFFGWKIYQICYMFK